MAKTGKPAPKGERKKAGPKVRTGTKGGAMNHNLKLVRFAKAPKSEKQAGKGVARKAGPKVKTGTKVGGSGIWSS
jgi:hypothetical protein